LARFRTPSWAKPAAASALLVAFAGPATAAPPNAWAELDGRSAAPGIRGITWRVEDIGGGGIIDRLRATLVLGADGVVRERTCAPALLHQESRFLEVLGAAQRVELLPTGALLLSGPDGQALRFFPETSR
jgi:heat shock protein HslJ